MTFSFSTLGIPFNDSVDWRLAIAEKGQQILGDNLLGLQAGNEPDLYQTFVPFFVSFIHIQILVSICSICSETDVVLHLIYLKIIQMMLGI